VTLDGAIDFSHYRLGCLGSKLPGNGLPGRIGFGVRGDPLAPSVDEIYLSQLSNEEDTLSVEAEISYDTDTGSVGLEVTASYDF